MTVSHRLLTGQDRDIAASLEDRDAEQIAADLEGFAERVYVPTDRAAEWYAQARRAERRERVFIWCLVAITLAWVAVMTLTACAVLRAMESA